MKAHQATVSPYGAAVQVAAEVASIAAIQPHGVQVWTASPHTPDEAQWSELGSLLDETERARVRQFKASEDRRAYVLAHALRRAALARVLAVTPGAVVVSHAANGKPLRAAAPGRPAIFFSHSRSREMVVCAVTRAGPVGIDVEPIDPVAADFGLLAPYMVVPMRSGAKPSSGPIHRRSSSSTGPRSKHSGRRPVPVSRRPTRASCAARIGMTGSRSRWMGMPATSPWRTSSRSPRARAAA